HWMHCLAGPVRDRHDEGLCSVDHLALNAAGNPAQCCIGQRPLALEYALGRYAPVDALRCRAVRLLALRWLGRMGRLRPYDRLPITPGEQEQALAAGRGSVVAGAQDAMLNHIAEGFQLTEEAPPGASFTLRVGHQERKSTRLNSSHVKISYAVFC